MISGRTRRVVPVLEHISDPHNASAILRSSEAFGTQEVHIVPPDGGFRASRSVTKGANRWLDLWFHRTTEHCLEDLEGRGYKVVVASMEGELEPADLRNLGKIAVVFGNEKDGVSEFARSRAKHSYRVPMRGFVESLNVSVAAAITLHSALLGPHALDAPTDGEFSDEERHRLTARFMMNAVRNSARIVELHLQNERHGEPTQ